MVRNRSHGGVIASVPAARLVAAAIAALMVSGVRIARTVSSPSSAATTTPASAAASAAPPSAAAPSASAAAAGPTCGTDPVELNAVFETGFRGARARGGVHKQFPNVTFNISQDQFANLITSTPRLLSSDNPPDLIRLPTMISLVKDGLLKNLDAYATAFGWDKWPAAAARPERVSTDGTRGSGSLYAMGLNYSLTGVFYNKELAAADRHDRAAQDGRRVRGPAGQGQGGRHPADHGLERGQERRRPRVPAAAPDGGLRPDPADQRLDLPEARARRSTPRPTSRPPSTSSSGSRPATSRRTPTRSSTPTPTAASARARACSCSTATGRTAATTRTCPATSASSCSRRPRPAERCAAMSAPLTYGIAQGQECRLRRLLPQLGRHERQGPRDRREGRRLEPWRSGGPGDAGGRRRIGHQGHARRGRGGRQGTTGRWTSSPTRPARSSPRAGRPSCRRWSAASRTQPACSRPSRPSMRRSSQRAPEPRQGTIRQRRVTPARSDPRRFGTSRRASLLRGVRRDALVGLAVRAARPWSCTRVFVLQPLVLTVQYSFYAGTASVRATWVGLDNYARS